MAAVLRKLLLPFLLLASTQGIAANYVLPLDIGNGAFKSCSGTGPTYTCTGKVDIRGGDTVVLTGDITLIVNGEFKVGGGNVNNSGFVFNVSAEKINIEGPGPVVMNELTASGDIIVHKAASLTGNLLSTGGDISIDNGNKDPGGNTVNGNIEAQTGGVFIAGGENLVDGNIIANGGAGPLLIDNNSIVTGTCNPDHPQCNGGPGPPPPGPACTTTQIAADGEDFQGISGSSDGNIIAVGRDGGIYQYNGTTWVKNAFVSPEELNDVEVIAANLAYAVGKKGTVLQFDGFNWTTLPAPTGEELTGVWSISSNEVWVVGKRDSLFLWNGTSWQDMSGGGQANVDGGQELRDAWGDANSFYALEKDGDLYRYSRPSGPWSKRTACSAAFDMDVHDIWGDGSGNIYIAGKDKDPKPDEAAIFLYNEASDSCSMIFSTATEDDLEGIYGDAGVIYAVGKGGLVVDNTSGSFSESIVGAEDYKDVWVSGSGTAYYAGKNGFLTSCNIVTGLDHFVISPATFAASTCLPNAITITAEDAANNTLASYTGTVSITTSSNHGNWSKSLSANGILNPDPDTDDDGAVDYSFDPLDAGVVTLDLVNTHAETITISVSEGTVTTTSAAIDFGDNVFVVTEDPVQVAGRPLAMTIAMWRNDRGAANCAIDTNYNYPAQSLQISIDRGGVLPAANDPQIGATPIVEAPGFSTLSFDFQSTPGQASFLLGNSDVGQYRLQVTDNTLIHSDTAIAGVSEIMTLRPFGIAVSNLRDTLTATPNPMNAGSAGAIFTTAGHDLSATVSGVLWDPADDVDNDGVLDTGVFADNLPAPSYAWDTTLSVSLLPASYTPSPGTPGTLNNNTVALGSFGGGSSAISDLQYTEVGSFTLQASALDYLGEPSADIGGDDVVVGRFIPASFSVGVVDDGVLAESCGAFTWVGEDFGYDTAPRISVTALNSLGDTTLQYRDAFVKLASTSVSVVASRDESTSGTDAVLLDVSYTPAAMTFAPQNNGIVNYTLGADSYRYGPNPPLGEFSKSANSRVAPFTADIDPEITAVSDGEVTSNYAPGTYLLNPTGNSLRFGRLRMDNVHGSELTPLLMPVFTEFWNGFGFQKNTLDTCSTIAAGDLVSVANPAGLSTPAVVNAPASAGDINYSYPAPGAGNDGYVDTTTNLSTAAQLWLRYDWDADGDFDDDPAARATFGIFEGNPVQIYIQQVYE